MKQLIFLCAALFFPLVGHSAEFLKDTFTGVSGTLVPNHTGEIGATWSVDSWNPGGVIQNNRAVGWDTNSGGADVVASAVPPSANMM